ncbi:peptidase C14 [Leifsonia naganoensis]|uniref:Peptidase C14 n=1 Tax=Leifsonia naganoensis TaxID=150025 RepID=A0A853DYH0_9MICO|nr:peptidase C14 [Leifsonia naganoensis]NYK12181.1 hypothetical protein [Leifsonia naganoensis]
MTDGTRRGLLVGLGAVALGGAGILSQAPAEPAAATSTASAGGGGSPKVVRTVADLGREKAQTGQLAIASGYRAPGDAGTLLYVGAQRSDARPNGGTIVAGRSGSVWRLLHDGTIDFRVFGVLGPDTPADDALDALLADPAVQRIEARTDLHFVRRHTSSRSGIELDFGGHLVTTDGIEPNTHDNPFGALLFFTGKPTGTTIEYALPEAWAELTDAVAVPDANAFPIDSWWAVQSDEVAGGGADERELQRFVRVTQRIDATHVRVDYLNGWALEKGRRLRWRGVAPVKRVRIHGMRFVGAGPFDGPTDGSFPDSREITGSHPVAFEYAVHCDVADIHASQTWWPVIMRRWNSHFVTERCSLENPPTVFYGGAGYLTQQIYCLYGTVRDCRSSNARHLNDLTASAYCLVENCHGDGDDQGGNPFTTHGQYEHDLTFVGNSGLMDIANSGAQWGTSAKRITVRDHTCSWFVASTKITDLTLENVRVLPRSTFDPQATLTINADGAQLRGCTAGLFAVGQRSSRSTRPTLIEGCTFSLPKGQVLVQTPVTATVTFSGCRIDGVDGTVARGAGALRFVDCALSGPAGGDAFQVASAELTVQGGSADGVALVATAARDQRVTVAGTRFSTTRTSAPTLARGDGTGTVSWRIDGMASDAPAGTPHLAIERGTNHLRLTGAELTGGALRLPAAGFGSGSTLLYDGATERRVERTLPEPTNRIIVGDVLVAD